MAQEFARPIERIDQDESFSSNHLPASCSRFLGEHRQIRQPHRETLQDYGFGRVVGVADGTPIQLAPGAAVACVDGHHRDGGFERDFGENIRYCIAIDRWYCIDFVVFHEIATPFPDLDGPKRRA
jgi:hypothetical protein